MSTTPEIEILEDEISLKTAHLPVFICSKIVGLFSFSISRSEKLGTTKKYYKFSLNVFWLFYTIVCLSLYFTCFGFCFVGTTDGETGFFKFPFITVVGHFIHILLGVFTTIIIYSFCLINYKNFEYILFQLQRIDDDLNTIHLKEKINYKAIYKFQIWMIVSGIILFILVSGYNAVMMYDIFDKMLPIVGYIMLAYVFPNVTSTIVQFQFIVAVYNIYHRFKMLNKFLKNISNVNKPTSKAVSMYKASQNLDEKDNIFSVSSDPNAMINDEDRPPSYSKLIQPSTLQEINSGLPSKSTDPLGRNTAQGTNENTPEPKRAEPLDSDEEKKIKKKFIFDSEDYKIYKSLHLKLNDIFILHDKLCDLSEVINDSFAIQLVACITSSFVITLFGFFFETKVIFMAWGVDFRLIFTATIFITWSFLLGAVIYLILVYCTSAREEASESALIIHKILQNKPAFMLNDEIYYSKMKSFTLQVLHRKNTFHFNGLGLFHLDYTFIFSVVSAATSYLIVLLQFDLTEDLALNKNSTKGANSTNTTMKV